MTPDEVAGSLEGLAAKASRAARPVVMAMAHAYQTRLQDDTLRRFSHAEDMKTNSPPITGTPAWVLGNLARSVRVAPGPGGADRAAASVAPHTVYARIQEVGGTVTARHTYVDKHGRVRLGFLKFPLNGKFYYKHSVKIPKRPYMEPTTHEMERDGSLTRRAAATFRAVVWGG